MAIIPRADESQVISAGSPVPISGTSEARMMNNAYGEFGESVMKLGAQLAQVEEATNREKRAIKSRSDVYKFENDVIDMDATFKNSDDYFEQTPSKLKDAYLNSLQKRKQEHLKNIPDDRKIFFENEIDKLITEKTTKFYADAVKDFSASAENDIEENFRELSSKVSRSLSIDETAKAYYEITGAIDNNQIFTAAEKQKLKTKYADEIVGSLVDGYVLNIERSKSQTVRNNLEEKALGLFAVGAIPKTTGEKDLGPRADLGSLLSRKAREDAIDRITKAKHHADQRELQVINRTEAMDIRATKQEQVKNYRDMYNIALNKVKSVEELQVFQADVRRRAEMGMLDPAKVKTLEQAATEAQGRALLAGTPQYSINTGYKNQMYDKFFKTDDILDLRETIYDDISKKKISPGLAIALQEDAEKLYNAFRKDPTLKSKVSNSSEMLSKDLQSPELQKLPREKQELIRTTVEKAKAKMLESVVANPQIDTVKLSNDLYTSDVIPVLKSAYNTGPKVRDTKELREQFKRIGDEYKDKKQRKKLTPADEMTYKKKLNDLLLQMKGGE